MTDPTRVLAVLDPKALSALNDLLQLDHDAVAAYNLAIGALTNVGRRQTIVRFRGDHERHIVDLKRLISRYGGTPVDASALPTGAFARAMQKLGTLIGDREVVIAFAASERKLSERYAKLAEPGDRYPDDVLSILRAAADDETRHHEWAAGQLETLGGPAESAATRVSGAVERVKARFADGVERAQAGRTRGVEAARRGAAVARRRAAVVRERLPEPPSRRVLTVGASAALVGFVITTAIGASLRRR